MSEEHRGLLPRFSIHRPITVLMTLLAMLVLGFIAYTRIPISMFPEGQERNTLVVWVSVPNSTPQDVEQYVARPIEDMIGTIPGVDSYFSRSNSGNCFTRISFDADMDIDLAYAELRDRMDRVMLEMPDEVDRIWVRGFDEGDIPVVELAVNMPVEVEDPFALMELYVQPALQRIQGVGNVEIFGLEGKSVVIELNQDLITAHGIDAGDLIPRLRGQDVNVPGGWVIEGDRKFYVRSLGRFNSLAEIENIIIDDESGLRVRDVASVSLRVPVRQRAYRIDGRPRVGVEVVRNSDGNIAYISRTVQETLKELKAAPQLAGVQFDTFFDQGQEVRQSIENLRNSILWGGAFAAVVLFIFLRAPRMTAIITLAIPLSLLSTVVVMYFMGWSLNMVTMAGLLLSLGLVVDNSIVIVENIYRLRQEGMEARRASIEGTTEVGLAVAMATLTTVVVFLPLILMSGRHDFSFLMVRLGVPVIVSLLASLFIALVFIPLAALKLSRGTKHKELGVIRRVRDWYLCFLSWILRHRAEAALLILLAMSSIVIPFKNVKRTDSGGRGENTVRLFIDMPTGQTLEQAAEALGSIENQLLAKKADYGFTRIESRFSRDFGRIYLVRKQDTNAEWYAVMWRTMIEMIKVVDREKTRQDIEADIKKTLHVPAGFVVRTSWRDSTDTSASTSVSLYGDDTETLVSLAAEVERRLATIPGVYEVETDVERGGTELQIQLDREQMQRLGVEPQAVSRTISYTLRGLRLGRYRTDTGREVDLTVQLEGVDNKGIDDVTRLSFENREGDMIPIESIATLQVEHTLGEIRRENRQTTLQVTARAQQENAGAMYASIDKVMAGFNMPRGYRWDKGTRWFRMEESNREQNFAIIMAVCFVFFLMGVLFESFLLPLAVIVAVPFALLGVYWTLYLTGTDLNLMAGIGIVVLVGVVVNNAIVLVDMINRLRAAGSERFEAVVTAARYRFRPIIMTTFTTGCGLIPMAFGDAQMGNMPSAPLGRVMMGGLLAATFLTLMIVPLFYTLLEDLRSFFVSVVSSATSRHRATDFVVPAGPKAAQDGDFAPTAPPGS